MDLALALKPLLLAERLVQIPDLANADNTYQHSSGYRVTLDPGSENWIAIWDENHNVICEARVNGPQQAVKLLLAYNLVSGVEVTDAAL